MEYIHTHQVVGMQKTDDGRKKMREIKCEVEDMNKTRTKAMKQKNQWINAKRSPKHKKQQKKIMDDGSKMKN